MNLKPFTQAQPALKAFSEAVVYFIRRQRILRGNGVSVLENDNGTMIGVEMGEIRNALGLTKDQNPVPKDDPTAIPPLKGDVTGAINENVVQGWQGVPLDSEMHEPEEGAVAKFSGGRWHAAELKDVFPGGTEGQVLTIVDDNPEFADLPESEGGIPDGTAEGDVPTWDGEQYIPQQPAGGDASFPDPPEDAPWTSEDSPSWMQLTVCVVVGGTPVKKRIFVLGHGPYDL